MAESGRTLGAYELEDSLGGTRTVFRARHLESGDTVCVKLLPEHLRLDAISRGRRKRDLLATKHVAHPGVGRPVDFAEADGRLFLVMEYIEGAPLSLALFGGATLPVSRALRVVRGACEAVAAAHASHATHGCVEPDKVLLGQDGLVHVVGFGFRDEDALKNPGGEPPAELDLCTAPERWSGAFETTEADVWALGSLLYRCLSGVFPFEAPTRAELSHKAQTSDVVPPSFEASIVAKPAIEAVTLRALSGDPTLRYPDAAVFARALLELEGMLPDESGADDAIVAMVMPRQAAPAHDFAAFLEPPAPPLEEPLLAGLDSAAADDGAASALFDPFASGLPTASEEGPAVVEESFGLVEDAVPAPPVEIDIAAGAEDALRGFEAAVAGDSAAGGTATPVASSMPPSMPSMAATPTTPMGAETSDVAGEDIELDVDIDDAPAPSSPQTAEQGAVVVTLPGEPPPPRSRLFGRVLLAGAAAAAAAVFFVVDPIALLGRADDVPLHGNAATTPTSAAASSQKPAGAASDPGAPSEGTEPTTAPASDGGAAIAAESGAADVGDGGERVALATASDGGDAAERTSEDGARDPALASADGEPGSDEAASDEEASDERGDEEGSDAVVASADLSPEEAYQAAEARLEKAIEERALLWKDDRGLDRLRLRSRKQARAKRFDVATKTVEKAVAAAEAVEIDARLVKRKLLRYVKRRKELGSDEEAKRARSIEYRARKHLKDGEYGDANKLLNAGLRLMYRQGDDG